MSRIYLSPPDVGDAERTALLRAFDSGWIAPVGPDLDAFETALTDIVGWPAVALSSGTAALHLALLAVGVRPGDDVVVSTFTFAATANAVVYCGAHPVFIDSDAVSWNMSPVLLQRALETAAAGNRLPKAVVVVDLYGQCADFRPIVEIARGFGVPVVEDAAEALGATYRERPAGSLGDISILSFNGNKITTTSGGGALLAPDRSVVDRARYLSTQARQPVAHYEHTDVGYNYRLSNLLAAVGRAQLERLPEMMDRRLAVNARYRSAFADLPVEFMPVPEWSCWNGWLTCLTFDDTATRDHVMHTLADHDVESRPLWKPLHLQPVFEDEASVVDGTSADLFARGLCLPSGSALSDDDVDRVCELVADGF